MAASLDKKMGTASAKVRDSSLELFRIVLMLMIISSHYVMNSGLCQEILQEGVGRISPRGLSFLMFGAWGKIGINCFLLITGYFMCTGQATVRKLLTLYFQILFYNVVVGVCFFAAGRETIGFTKMIFHWFWPFKNLTSGFTGAFLAFYVFIPFLNVLINSINRRSHLVLLLALLFVFSFLPTLPCVCINVANNYVCWFAVVYIAGAYIRKYPLKSFEHRGYMACLAGVAFVIGNLSVVAMANLLPRFEESQLPWSYWVFDSEKITAFAAAAAFFLFFRSLRLPYLKVVNVIASATFGVLLIHANSNAMRHWLWRDVCQNIEYYSLGIWRAAGVVMCVYVVCVLLELCRQRLFKAFGALFRMER